MIFSIRHLRPHIQLRLFAPSDVDQHVFVDDLAGMSLIDVKAFALDPDVTLRRLAARSRMNLDAGLQRILCTDPDESVVLELLSQVDPTVEMCSLIIDGPHVNARRNLARRHLTTDILRTLTRDEDDAVRELSESTLTTRGIPTTTAVAR